MMYSFYVQVVEIRTSIKQFYGYLLLHPIPVTPSLCCQSIHENPFPTMKTILCPWTLHHNWGNKSRYAFPFPLSSGPVPLPSESLESLRRGLNWIRGSLDT